MSTSTETELKRYDHSQGPRKLGPSDGKLVDLSTIGVRFMAWTEETGGGFSLVEHPMPPRMLAAPVHKHSREDEYSFVLEGRMGALLGDETVFAETGDFVFKPRDQWHTFWNAGDEPCRILEIICPGGFEHYFDEMAAARGGARCRPRGDRTDRRALRHRVRLRARAGARRGARADLPDGGVAMVTGLMR